MASRILQTTGGTLLVVEDYEEVRSVLLAYEDVNGQGNQPRYAEFTLPSRKDQEEQPVSFDLEKYVDHRPVQDETPHLSPAEHPASVGDR